MEKMAKSSSGPQILIVDDVETNTMILENIIEEMGYVPKCASSVGEAVSLMAESMPQLILLDIFMPEVDGYEFCERLKKNPVTRDIPVIFISGSDASEDKIKGFSLGAVDYISKPFEISEVTMRVKKNLKIYEMQQELELLNKRLHSVIYSQAKRIEEEQKNILYAIAALTEERDCDTKDHLNNVSYNCRLIAQSLQFSPDFDEEVSQSFIDTIEVASRLHDIGKVQTPDEILRKPGSLADHEMEIVRRHVIQGAELLKRIYESSQQNEFLPMAIEISRYHHARWDGLGYPEGTKGTDIPLSARITIIADIYDTLTGKRVYKSAYDEEKSIEIIAEGSGTFFDPRIVDVFLKIKRQLRHS